MGGQFMTTSKMVEISHRGIAAAERDGDGPAVLLVHGFPEEAIPSSHRTMKSGLDRC